jgi:hypothetical protein
VRSHRPDVLPVRVPEWTLHRPTCSCGWTGDTVRTRAFADDQVNEHLAATTDTAVVQPALPGL